MQQPNHNLAETTALEQRLEEEPGLWWSIMWERIFQQPQRRNRVPQPEHRPSQAPSTREHRRQDSFNHRNNTLSPPAPRSNDNLTEITALEQRLQESNIVGSQVEHRPPQAPSTRERSRQQSFNQRTNTLLDPTPQINAPQAIIRRLRCYKYTHQMAFARKDDIATCSICLGEVYIGQKVRVLTCEHEFHARCVGKWLLKHLTCPMCRSAVQ